MTELATDSLSEHSARRSLERAALIAGLPADNAKLIRLGSNAVFRLDPTIIARVAPDVTALPNAVKQIAVSRWLDAVGYPVTRASRIAQPIEADGRVVTFWESIAPETTYAPIRQVAVLIRRLHELPPPPPSVQLPTLHPFGQFDVPLPTFEGLDPADAGYLRDRYAGAREQFAAATFPLGAGVIHGDANVGNVLVDGDGNPVLIDLDSFSIGPREWDLIQTALFADRFGWHTAEEYQTFVEVYGYDITEWEGYEALADMREVAMTAWISKKAATDEAAAGEAHKRIAAMRSGGSRRDWGAY
ncbi:phosphotransferase family protein [Pseudonocardia humida]|uniref:Aminoglycoside phosphotransferase family protein n=1 Tax=Pseudonocardia humida TaxID=2800819 RepID=A0ABT1A792_9PSEU|nr:aminoglycoside phosphotransferase family protein [Pseudonocardia humida]MCO1658887.1 aminoglycoside phosphotransferase family protein [Pseudonocardia humida]